MSNQHLRDDILFYTGMSWPVTELSIRGDSMVLYTEDTEIYRRYRKWQQAGLINRYTQANSLVGVDIYFPRAAKKQLVRSLKQVTAARRKRGVS